jgi:hypothetical protein
MTVSPPGILAIFNNIAPGREAEFEEWFQHEHLQERLGVPGFLFGRRHEVLNGEPRYFNFYVTRSVEVLKSQEYRGRLNNPTPMTRLIMSEVFKDMIRTVCHRTYRLGHMRGAVTVTARFTERPNEAVLKSVLKELIKNKAVACGEVWSAVSQDELPLSEEERLRGGDRRIDACLVIETLRARDAEQVASALSSQFSTAAIAIYRLLCEITP